MDFFEINKFRLACVCILRQATYITMKNNCVIPQSLEYCNMMLISKRCLV